MKRSLLLLLFSSLLALPACGDVLPWMSSDSASTGVAADVEGDAGGECSDGADNDQDGKTDCADDTCAADLACAGRRVVSSEPLRRGDREAASASNKAGMRHYKRGRMELALAEFEAAVEADPSYHWGHFNLACTLGIFRSRGQTCEHEAYKSRITDHLTIFMQLKPDLREKMRKDSDLTSVRDTFAFQTLAGLSPTDTSDVTRILQRVTWYGSAMGLAGPTSGVDFRSNGAVQFWSLDVESYDRSTGPVGTYSVNGNTVRIELRGNSREQRSVINGILTPDGKLRLPGLSTVDSVFTDDPADCSA